MDFENKYAKIVQNLKDNFYWFLIFYEYMSEMVNVKSL
jgi:hypothetical protein